MTDWRGLAQPAPEGTTRREALIHFESFAATFQASGGDSDLILRALAEAALAQPEPEGPSDEELDHWWAEIDGGPDCCAWRPYARAVLARFGRPAIEPVPVRERLPGPEDCDEKGRCWAWNPEAFWWDLCQLKFIKMNAGDPFTHWLPHWALPVPTSGPEVKP